jgi:tRNA 2-selenouridine synthase
MRAVNAVVIERSVDERVQVLSEYYNLGDTEALVESTRKLAKRLGNERTQEVVELFEQGNFKEAVRGVLPHYDRTYKKGMARREPETLHPLDASGRSPGEVAAVLIDMAPKLTSR